MINLKDINISINKAVKKAVMENFDYEIPIAVEDLSEPIIRPSLKVFLENTKTGRFNNQCKERSVVCRIYFFAKDRYRYKKENLEMQDILENAFYDGIQVKEDFFIEISEVEFLVSDTVLICSFDLLTVEVNDKYYDGNGTQPMEELVINKEE